MAAALTSLLKSLTIAEPNHEDILRACNNALKENKGSVDAQHARVVALLNLDRYDDALRQLEDGEAALKQRAQLEYAYALYKVGRLKEARQQSRSLSSRGGRHVEAQALYRLEEFERARSLYKMLQQAADAQDEENDLRINSSATDAQLEWQHRGHLGEMKKVSSEDLEAFETAFNAACACIARGELQQAEFLLARARSLCLAVEDLSEEGRKAELLPISVQQLYVFTQLGKVEQANRIAQELKTDSAPDSSTSKLAQVNKTVVDGTKTNPYMSERVLRSAAELPLSDQFFGYQNHIIRQNDLALNFLSGKYTGLAHSTAKQIREQKVSTTSREMNVASSANAAAHAQLQLGKAGLGVILTLLEKRPYDIGLVATVIQLYILMKNHSAAIKLMEELCSRLEQSQSADDLDVRFSPGIVAILKSLYSVEGHKAAIRTELAKAASHWRRKQKMQLGLMKAAGYVLVKSGTSQDLAEAQIIFSTLSEQYSSDRAVAAGKFASGAALDNGMDSPEVDMMSSIDKLVSGIEVDSIEAAGIPQPASAATMLSRKRAADAAKPAKKRLRKSRLPKDYDPNKKVDPERWIPLRDRSYYKPKGKRKGKNLAQGGAQGALATNSDITTSGQRGPTVVQPTPAPGGGKSKKKKNKR